MAAICCSLLSPLLLSRFSDSSSKSQIGLHLFAGSEGRRYIITGGLSPPPPPPAFSSIRMETTLISLSHSPIPANEKKGRKGILLFLPQGFSEGDITNRAEAPDGTCKTISSSPFGSRPARDAAKSR